MFSDLYQKQLEELIDTKEMSLTIQEQRIDYPQAKFNYWMRAYKFNLHTNTKSRHWLGSIEISAYPECCGACIVHNLIVTKRREKIGTKLLSIAEKAAKFLDYSVMHGIIPITYMNHKKSSPAYNFFLKNGFTLLEENRIKNQNTNNWLIPIIKEIK